MWILRDLSTDIAQERSDMLPHNMMTAKSNSLHQEEAIIQLDQFKNSLIATSTSTSHSDATTHTDTSSDGKEKWWFLCPIRIEYTLGRTSANILPFSTQHPSSLGTSKKSKSPHVSAMHASGLDMTVSRKHATLRIEKLSHNSHAEGGSTIGLHSRLWIQDNGSKFGTFVYRHHAPALSIRVPTSKSASASTIPTPSSSTSASTEQGQWMELFDGDWIRLGTGWTWLRVSLVPVGVLISNVQQASARIYEENAAFCDYVVINPPPSAITTTASNRGGTAGWMMDVTHCVMKKSMTTPKALRALQSNRYVVSENWLRVWITYAQELSSTGPGTGDAGKVPLKMFEWPDERMYVPDTDERMGSVVSGSEEGQCWMPNPKRKHVFRNVTVLCPMDKLEKIREFVETSRGVVHALADVSTSILKESVRKVGSNGRAVVWLGLKAGQEPYFDEEVGVGVIGESEIGMAILRADVGDVFPAKSMELAELAEDNDMVESVVELNKQAFMVKPVKSGWLCARSETPSSSHNQPRESKMRVETSDSLIVKQYNPTTRNVKRFKSNLDPKLKDRRAVEFIPVTKMEPSKFKIGTVSNQKWFDDEHDALVRRPNKGTQQQQNPARLNLADQSFGFDGASVNQGKADGLGSSAKREFEWDAEVAHMMEKRRPLQMRSSKSSAVSNATPISQQLNVGTVGSPEKKDDGAIYIGMDKSTGKGKGPVVFGGVGNLAELASRRGFGGRKV